MQELSNLLGKFPIQESQSNEEFVASFNARSGTEMREGYHCSVCNDKELVLRIEHDRVIRFACRCMGIRNQLACVRKSSLCEQFKEGAFEKFNTAENWQTTIKNAALQYAHSDTSDWFFLSGQTGCGKTHLCSAIARERIIKGYSVEPIRWAEWSVKAKGLVTSPKEYAELLEPLKTCDVLYLDDFLKVSSGNTPTTADLRLAFELIDARYNQKHKPVILSSEFSLRQILSFDEALGGRIRERTKQYCITVEQAANRNHRFK